MKPSIFTKWFQDFPKKKNFVETIQGFKKTVQNQKHPGRLMKKLYHLLSFFIKKQKICTKHTMLMSKFDTFLTGFKVKNAQMGKLSQSSKLP